MAISAVARLEAHLRMLPGYYAWVGETGRNGYKLLDAIYATVTALQTEFDLSISEANYESLRADRLYVELGFAFDWKKFEGWSDDEYRDILVGLNKSFLLGFTQPGVQAGVNLFLGDRFTYEVGRVESDLVQDVKRFYVHINMSSIPSDFTDVIIYLRKFLDDIKSVTSFYDLGVILNEVYHGTTEETRLRLGILASPEYGTFESYRDVLYMDAGGWEYQTTDEIRRNTFTREGFDLIDARDLGGIHNDTGGTWFFKEW